ncbi:hypothetical protein E1262_25325 [Jiangella aurantiaca]|uniref:Uncharacterized protein n=1 Tax=Jiangella aurantiaca TaxID=2530373 RepID=A0A4R5A115_9ACTN|nr:hypothetical protein [Jiangella aurantiaca]TDD65401.1 hypothetical protein E1262_25325 [Jiangella aurantiaca]
MRGGVDPRHTQPGLDVPGPEVPGLDILQCGHVHRVPIRVGLGGRRGGGEFLPDIARQVLRRGEQLLGLRVVVDEFAQHGAGLVLADPEQPCHLHQVDAAVRVQHHGQRLLRGVRAQDGRAGGDDALRHDRGRGGGLGDVVEHLQPLHQRRERVGAEDPHHRRRDP